MKAKYDQYIHEYYDESGNVRYSVAWWDENTGQYQRPLDARTRALTGCHTEYTHRIKEFGGYLTKRQALRRARYLFGENE